MSASDSAREYERANAVLDALAGLFDTTREQLPTGVGAFHRPEGLGVFLPLPVMERVLRALDVPLNLADSLEQAGVPIVVIDPEHLAPDAEWVGRGGARRNRLRVMGFAGDPENPQPLDRVECERLGPESAAGGVFSVAFDQLAAGYEPVGAEVIAP